jgi:hypothetical protein
MRNTGYGLGLAVGLLVAILAVGDGPAFSAQEREKKTLRGVEGFDVFVRVRARDAGAKALGVTQEQVQRDLEARLEKARIRVVRNARAHLLLSVSIISISHPRVDGILAYVSTAQLKFRQGAVLEGSGAKATVTTWDEIRFGATSPTKNMDKRIRKSIGSLVDVFVQDYLEANADREPAQRQAD